MLTHYKWLRQGVLTFQTLTFLYNHTVLTITHQTSECLLSISLEQTHFYIWACFMGQLLCWLTTITNPILTLCD